MEYKHHNGNISIDQDRLKVSTLRIPVVIKLARTALGWSQQELATKLGVGKATLARYETAETEMGSNLYLSAVSLFANYGVEITLLEHGSAQVVIHDAALLSTAAKLITQRRIDRKKVGFAFVSTPIKDE